MGRCVDIEKKLVGQVRTAQRDRVLVLIDEIPKETATNSGIILPGNQEAIAANERVGTVISAGKDVVCVKTGDRVLMHKAYGHKLPHEDMLKSDLVMVSMDQIEGVLTGDAERDDYALERDGLS